MELNTEHIKLLQQGNATMQKQVFEKLFSTMFRVCQRYIVRTDEAEDCVMKGFLKAFKQMDQFHYQGVNSFTFWLKRIMVTESLMALRKQHNFHMVAVEQVPEVEFDDTHLQQVDAAYLYQAILTLPSGYRTVFNLFVIEGYSHQEISVKLGISESTSKTQLAKAKQKLQHLLTQQQYGYGNGR